ncbi:hypothetical protein CH263_22470 [Rhodococcus sp. 06-1059B-a]|nr:TRAP transporter small permease [Rhodococcus sp. 06-1059B-a]OZD59767.1 hypothetical protein CH263_22470 [Rhodococcus sp. 06-1059B-a]
MNENDMKSSGWLSRVRALLLHVVEVVAGAVLIVMTMHVVANGLMRSFAGAPIEHTLEYVQYWYLPVIAMLGFLSAQMRGRHITADILYQVLPRTVKPWVTVWTNIACAVVMCAFAWGTWGDALHRFDIRQTAGLTDVPTWPVYLLLPMTFVLLAAGFATASWRGLRRGEAFAPATEADEVKAALAAEGAVRDSHPGRRTT